MPTLSHDSEYVRLNYNQQQQVITDLDFKGDILIKAATSDNNPVNYKQLKDAKAAVEAAIVNGANRPNEKINKVSFKFEQGVSIGYYYNIGTSGYTGLSNIIFLKADGSQLYPIAFTLGCTSIGYNNALTNAQYSQVLNGERDDWFYIWYAETPTADNLTTYASPQGINGIRQIANPDNLSIDDETYFAQYNRVLKMKARRSSCMVSSSNNVEWSHPMKAISTKLSYSGVFGGANDGRNGLLTDTPCITDIEFVAENQSLLFDIVGCYLVPFAYYTSFNTPNIYGNIGWTKITKTINDKYVESYSCFDNLYRDRILNYQVWLSCNLTRDAQYNDVKWIKHASDTWSDLADFSVFGVSAKSVWNPTTNKFDIINGTSNTNDMDTLYNDWKIANQIP